MSSPLLIQLLVVVNCYIEDGKRCKETLHENIVFMDVWIVIKKRLSGIVFVDSSLSYEQQLGTTSKAVTL